MSRRSVLMIAVVLMLFSIGGMLAIGPRIARSDDVAIILIAMALAAVGSVAAFLVMALVQPE